MGIRNKDRKYYDEQVSSDIGEFAKILGDSADRRQRGELAKQQQDAALAQLIKGHELKQADDVAANEAAKKNIDYILQMQAQHPDMNFTMQGESVRKEDSLANQIAKANAMSNIQEKRDEKKQQQKLAGVAIPGTSFVDPENVMPGLADKKRTIEDLAQAKNVLNTYDQIDPALNVKESTGDKAAALIGNIPLLGRAAKYIGGDKYNALQAAANKITLQEKEAANLGAALSANEKQILDQSLGNLNDPLWMMMNKDKVPALKEKVKTLMQKGSQNKAQLSGYSVPETYYQSGGEAPQTKIIGGKAFKKVPGGWEEQ